MAHADEVGVEEDATSEARPGAPLEERVAKLEAELEAQRAASPRVHVRGYADVGLFVTQGDGSGIRQDIGNQAFPEYEGFAWTFYGDLMSPPVNSRGRPRQPLPGVMRTDAIHSQGAPSFLINEVNLTVDGSIGQSALLTTIVNFLPSWNDPPGPHPDYYVIQLDASGVLHETLPEIFSEPGTLKISGSSKTAVTNITAMNMEIRD